MQFSSYTADRRFPTRQTLAARQRSRRRAGSVRPVPVPPSRGGRRPPSAPTLRPSPPDTRRPAPSEAPQAPRTITKRNKRSPDRPETIRTGTTPPPLPAASPPHTPCPQGGHRPTEPRPDRRSTDPTAAASVPRPRYFPTGTALRNRAQRGHRSSRAGPIRSALRCCMGNSRVLNWCPSAQRTTVVCKGPLLYIDGDPATVGDAPPPPAHAARATPHLRRPAPAALRVSGRMRYSNDRRAPSGAPRAGVV